jgi:hypothetical protein
MGVVVGVSLAFSAAASDGGLQSATDIRDSTAAEPGDTHPAPAGTASRLGAESLGSLGGQGLFEEAGSAASVEAAVATHGPDDDGHLPPPEPRKCSAVSHTSKGWFAVGLGLLVVARRRGRE